ncbi:MAG: winged helix DNA-binding domain-containing protein [Nocardioidaceae bacterium]
MDVATIARWRMRNLLVWRSGAVAVSDVMGRLTASQAQDLLPGKWSIAQRVAEGSSDVQLDACIDRGDLLRTHLLRPTWHFVAPQDIRWLLRATAPRVHQLNAYYNRSLGVDDSVAAVVRRVLETALAGGRHRTRTDLAEELRRAGVESPAGPRLAYLLMRAELDAVICSGSRQRGQQTYALLDERAPEPDDRTRDEALTELARRYFRSRGPATDKDLARWASLTVAEAQRARAACGNLEGIDLDGRTYWVADGQQPPETKTLTVDLVQAYDECVMSYSQSKDVLSAGPVGDAGPPPSGFFHALLVDGRLVGHWRYVRDGKDTPNTVQTHLYRTLSGAEREALDHAVARFGDFVGSRLSLA